MTRDTTGAVTIEAVPQTDLKKREKACDEDYAQSCKAYKEAKKDNPSEPKPVKAGVRILEKLVKGKDKAEALAAKYRETHEAKKGEKDAGDKPTEEKPKTEAGKGENKEG